MERQDRNQIIMLGTGYATATHCYNTCFILKTPDTMLLVDAGGGNGILNQLEEAKINLSDIHSLFITHAHTDHILGVVATSSCNASTYYLQKKSSLDSALYYQTELRWHALETNHTTKTIRIM